MADNAPVPEGAPQPPALPTAPPMKTAGAGKVVVLLSSVAKAPPVKTQAITHVAPAPSTPKEAPLRPSLKVVAPPPLPAKQAVGGKLLRPGGKAEVKVLTKTTVLSSTTNKIQAVAKDAKVSTPTVAIPNNSPANTTPPSMVPSPGESGDAKKTSARLSIPPIKLNQPVPEPEKEEPGESILLGPGETAQEFPTRPFINETASATSPDEVKTKVEAAPSTVPPPSSLIILPPVAPTAPLPTSLQPPVVLNEGTPASPAPGTSRPPPLPKLAAKPPVLGVNVVPKLAGSEPAEPKEEKLRPPPLRPEGGREGDKGTPAVVAKELAPPLSTRPALPAKAPPTASPGSKVTGPITQREKETLPPIDSAKATGRLLSKPEENRPALRPPVLPNKALASLKAEAESTTPKVETEEKLPPPLSVVPDRASTAKTSEVEKRQAPVELPSKTSDKPDVLAKEKALLPPTRAERAKKRRRIEAVIFYVILLAVGGLLYWGTIKFCRETKMEGQVIPPAGMPLADEVWIVSDFRQLTAGIAEDLSEERTPLMLELHEKQDHVQRVQADLAMREERIRLLQAQIQATKDEEAKVVMQAHDAAQQLWDGPGAQLDDDYNARRISLQDAIANRAKSLNLKYDPDPAYNAPEVWANAYRLALYQVPAGVDATKEYQWLAEQMKGWRDFVKAQDDKREQLREQAAQIKMSPAAKLTDLNAKIDELQHRIDNTQAEEEPLKPELQQAQADLAEVQTAEAGLDAKYYKQLSALPVGSVTKRLPMEPNGRFSWPNLDNDSPFAEGEKEHRYWIFARATRADGREYWALGRFTIEKDHTLGLLIEPDSFVSTKAMLRPDLSPDEQAQ